MSNVMICSNCGINPVEDAYGDDLCIECLEDQDVATSGLVELNFETDLIVGDYDGYDEDGHIEDWRSTGC